jgi:hypothetical protein
MTSVCDRDASGRPDTGRTHRQPGEPGASPANRGDPTSVGAADIGSGVAPPGDIREWRGKMASAIEQGVSHERWRWDLNPHTGEISPITGMNTKTSEKSPDWGSHAFTIPGAPRPASSQINRLGGKAGWWPFLAGGRRLPGRLASVALTWHPRTTEPVAPAGSSGRVGATRSISVMHRGETVRCSSREPRRLS